jgi:uncharacterized membrane protein
MKKLIKKMVGAVAADAKANPNVVKDMIFFVVFFFIVYPLFLRP